MNHLASIITLGSLLLHGSLMAEQKSAPTFDPALYEKIKMLSPEESITKIELPEGYSLEPVLSEPNITEPSACVFDGNGRMYVVEMNTYMQDGNAKGQTNQTSRISRHEDTNGDGIYNKHSVFIDNLLIPRMVLPLEDGIVIGITNTLDLWLYKDTDGDGVADKKSLYYKGGKRGGNMEHQPSGLIWSLDNWVYTTYTPARHKFGPEKLIATESTGVNGGQWGLTQDNYGKPWFVNAGGERGPVNYQYPILYGTSNHFKNQAERDFKDVFPICDIPDVQGGLRRTKPFKSNGTQSVGTGKVLNHFTATCGQDIYRGDRLPKELYGNLLFAEPVGRFIRRAKINVNDGVTHLSNAHPKSEFIRSTDPNFRPINMVTAPDGTLYIVDMYRGIIQESSWTKPGSYLRGVIDQYGLDKNIQHGRIYRLVHKDFKRGPKPNMIGAESSELVKHLSHPNGWWRDTAQKILVLRADQSVTNELVKLTNSNNHLAKIHALWTLEGIGSLTEDHVTKALNDELAEVRRTAIRIAETLIKSNHTSSTSLQSSISQLISDKDPQVVMQVILTAKLLQFKNSAELNAIAAKSTSPGVLQTAPKSNAPKVAKLRLPKGAIKQHKRGGIIYKQLCSSCHGEDGNGTLAGKTRMAPPLAGSASVNGHHDQFINIVLHGLEGPVNGKKYTAPMVSMKSQDDQWIADIATYLKNEFGNNSGCVEAAEVAAVRAQTKDRTKPWTLTSLSKEVPQALDRKQWKVTASHNSKEAKLAIDGKDKSRYTTKASQKSGMWYQIEFPEAVNLTSVRLDSAQSANDFPSSYQAEISLNGSQWDKVQKTVKGDYSLTSVGFPATSAKFFRITTKSNKRLFWSIHEIQAFAMR
jgi:mono/diheme cytochrome c family protein/glucose/arabinose dehydrogenase